MQLRASWPRRASSCLELAFVLAFVLSPLPPLVVHCRCCRRRCCCCCCCCFFDLRRGGSSLVIDLTNLRPGSGGRECSVQLRMPRLREAVGQTSGQAAVAAVTASRPTDCRRTVWEHGSYCCCCCCCCRRRRVGCFESPSRGGHPACARDGCAAAWRRSRAPSAWRPLASSCSSTSGTDSLPWRVAAASMSMCRRPRDSADSHTSIVHTGIPADAYCTVYSATAVVQVQDLTLIRFIAACHHFSNF